MTKKKLSVSLALIWMAVFIVSGAAIMNACSASNPTDTPYPDWTASTWKNATDPQRLDAALAVLSGIADKIGVDDSTVSQAALQDSAEEMVDEIDDFFKTSKNATLQDLVDQSAALLGA